MAKRMTARSFVGTEIRKAREARGLSRAKLAKLLIVSDSLIAAWESGRQAILAEHMKRLLGINDDGTREKPVLDFPPDVMLRMVEQLVNGEALPDWEGKWLTAEESTFRLYGFDPYLINRLLQCPEYMEEILGSEESIKARQERQRRFLSADTGAGLVARMSESALRINVGGPEVMSRQMAFLVECAELENIFLHIIPMKSRICAKFRAPFMIAALEQWTT